MSFEVDPVVTAAPTEMSTGEVGGMLDFNFDLDEGSESSIGSESFSSKNDSPLDLSGISLDLDDAQTSDLDAMSMDSGFNMEDEDLDDPVATKLDLAKAYIEMGDEEGAREILSEVETEGQPDQQAEARKLLKSL